MRFPRSGGVLGVALVAAIGTPLFVSMPAAALAASPVVVESRESTVTYQRPIEEEAPGEGIENQYQLQLLQQEVMELRGMVERLDHELQRQKKIQDDRYLELDGRLQQLLAGQADPTDGTGSLPAGDDVPPAAAPGATAGMSEKELYDTTQLLIRNRQYELAITQLESLIARFPDGVYTPNAYYWLGQVYAARSSPDFEKARQALAQVISYFPDHPKVPDAAYALGKVYHALGDCKRARDLLTQVVDQYPGKSAAKLAESYLNESVDCGN